MKATANNSVKINKSMVMKAAWDVLRKHKATNLAEALRMAWKAYKLKAQLSLGVVKFTFRKINGEVRQAVGTLANNFFQYTPKGNGGTKTAGTICYFDLEKHAFRSFCVYSLL